MTKPDNSQELIRNFLMKFQDDLTTQLEKLDHTAKFVEDKWQRSHLGSGRTRVITDGSYLEQGGIGFSEITGNKIPPTLLGQKPELEGQSFWGAGVSMVLHPRNPFCPTVHLNYRYFEAGDIWWFAGGADLTPYYAFVEDCKHWHQVHKTALDKLDPNLYPAFKYWCDEYFYLHHRNESRGIGGVFFDYQDGHAGHIIKADYARKSDRNITEFLEREQDAKNWQELFTSHKETSYAFFDAYLPIANKRKQQEYNEAQRAFQLYRRGRYVEFNLLYDRGTLFGLQSKGRVESILMSLPPLVRWEYNFQPEAGSAEEELTKKFLHRGIDWI